MIIRLANTNDCPDIAKVLTLTWKSAYKGLISQRFLNKLNDKTWVERLRKQIEGGKTTILVAEKDSSIIGAIGYGKSRFDEEDGWGEIYSLYVLPHYQGQQIGKQLFNSAENDLSKQFTQLKVLAIKNNTNAIRFYQQMNCVLTNNVISSEIDGKSYQMSVLEKVLSQE